MKAEQVDQALAQKFVTEGARLVFWHDSRGEFADYVGNGLDGELASVQVLDVGTEGGLSAKLRLEREDPQGQYLVYSQGEAPQPDQDWLLDIRLYSDEFHADVASLWVQELGLASLSLRAHLRERRVFMGNQERRRRLARFVAPEDDAAALDLKMLAVLSGSPIASPFEVLVAVADGHVADGAFDLSSVPEVVAQFEKMGLIERFWAIARREFGYSSDTPSVAGLLRCLFVSELIYEARGGELEALAHHELSPQGTRNAVVFLTQWRDSSARGASYDAAADAVAAEQKVDDLLGELPLEALSTVFTFWEAERRVVAGLKDRLLDAEDPIDVDALATLISERKAGHWLAGAGRSRPERRAIADAYDAIHAAAVLFALERKHRGVLSFDDADALLHAYQSELYRFDQLYRQFCARSRAALDEGWDLLKSLSARVERVYDQGFLQPLGREWSRLLDAGFLQRWSSASFPAQAKFYARTVQPYLAASERRRGFVIISDALRYEAGRELLDAIKARCPVGAELTSMLGVLPSYTALGMASLLPHDQLEYSKGGEVLADGVAMAGTDARGRCLAAVDGVACQAKALREMPRADARALVKGRRVVYIYHNVIDARGDSAPTENETFEAVADCIKELVAMVQFCVNTLNAGRIWITSDHGFLYQREAPGDTHRSTLTHKPTHAVKSKKRYVIGKALGAAPEAHHGRIEDTVGAAGDMEFWVPRGANRFHFTGGARFVHGGAMPQEVMVPLLTLDHRNDAEVRGERRSEKVAIQVLGSNHKITTPTYRFEIIQADAVGDRRLPITVRAAVYEGAEPVTSIETLTFDSASASIDERKKSLRLELRSGTFDKTRSYRLVLRDVETDAEVQSMPVVIDRSFDDDF